MEDVNVRVDSSDAAHNGYSCFDPSKPAFRYTLLGFNCLLTFGSYYCFDMPTVLESAIEDQVVAQFTSNVSTYYNLFYTIYAWTNMCMSLIAGVVIDKYGTRFSSFLFLSLCLVGSSLFALGAIMKGSSGTTRYVTMFIGRFIFGLGGGSITIVQNAITAKWFKGRELAFAFGCTLTISRIGSVVNYDATSLVYDSAEDASPGYGLGITLFIGSALVALSFGAAMGIMFMEKTKATADRLEYGDAAVAAAEEQGGLIDDATAAEDKTGGHAELVERRSYLQDVAAMPSTFWVVCLIITFFYNLVFPWQAIAVDFIRTSYGDHPNEWASWRASMVYMVSMIVSPFLGAAVDYFGRRDWLTIFGTGLSIPVFILLGNSNVEPVIPLLLLGVCYSVCAAALWPTLQILVDSKMVGRANGIATSMQMLGIGICNIVVGNLKDSNKQENPLAPSCCDMDPNKDACFDEAYTGSCAPSQYGRCSSVEVAGVDYSLSCQSVNYAPMLHFFTAMACVALVFACVLKAMDRTEYALYMGIRDKVRVFKERHGREPRGDEMQEASRLTKDVLRGHDVLVNDASTVDEPLLGHN